MLKQGWLSIFLKNSYSKANLVGMKQEILFFVLCPVTTISCTCFLSLAEPIVFNWISCLVIGLLVCEQGELLLQDLLLQLDEAAWELLSPGHHVRKVTHPLQVLCQSEISFYVKQAYILCKWIILFTPRPSPLPANQFCTHNNNNFLHNFLMMSPPPSGPRL